MLLVQISTIHKNFKKAVFTASRLGIQHKWDNMEQQLQILFVASLPKTRLVSGGLQVLVVQSN